MDGAVDRAHSECMSRVLGAYVARRTVLLRPPETRSTVNVVLRARDPRLLRGNDLIASDLFNCVVGAHRDFHLLSAQQWLVESPPSMPDD